MTLYHEYTKERNIMIVVVAIYLNTSTLIVLFVISSDTKI